MNIDIKKFFHSTQTSLDAEGATHEFMRPVRDWMFVLGSAVLVFGVGVAYSVYDFYMQFGVPQEASFVEEKHVRYRDKEVQSVASLYAEKEIRFSALRGNKPITPEAPVTNNSSNTPVLPEGVTTEATPLADTPVGEYTEGAPTLSP